MEYAVVALPAAPMRRKANHREEMVSQLLFGESVAVTRSKGDIWLKVRSLHDEYEGWMTRNFLEPVEQEEAAAMHAFVTTDLLSELSLAGRKMRIPVGSSLPGFADGSGKIGSLDYTFNGHFRNRLQQYPDAGLLQELSFGWLNAPYLWGGRTPLGVDCSGFVQVNYKMMGVNLPRDAWQQAQEGSPVKKLKDAQAGDLAFFDDNEEIVHVGILLDPEQIIHSSGCVRIDPIDKKGILHSVTGKRTHRLRAIRRCW